MKNIFSAILVLTGILLIFSFKQEDNLTGAWQRSDGSMQEVLIFQDGYFTHTTYDKNHRKFVQTKGGTYSQNGAQLQTRIEFSTAQPKMVGETITFMAPISKNGLATNIGGRTTVWTRIDNGTGGLAGNWRITGRMNNGEVQQLQRTARKTLKILSGTRFQWIAINPETKEFFGTGGGTYTFNNGKYTERIEFFSRDSSRVGVTLTFDGNVSNNIWTHKGTSSAGAPLHEEWTRER